MNKLTVTKAQGAKCNISQKNICIATRSRSQADSFIILTPTKPIKTLNLELDISQKNFFHMDIIVITNDDKEIEAGTITNKNLVVNIQLDGTLIKKITLNLKNTTKEEKNFTLKSHAA